MNNAKNTAEGVLIGNTTIHTLKAYRRKNTDEIVYLPACQGRRKSTNYADRLNKEQVEHFITVLGAKRCAKCSGH